MMIASKTVGTFKAADQRVDGNTPTGERSLTHNTDRLMPENEWRNPSFIMAVPGMHVRTADTTEGNIDDALADPGDRRIDVTDFTGFGAGIDKCLHFAVNPPSTMRTCPVTYADASEQRNSSGPSMSSSFPLRPIHV